MPTGLGGQPRVHDAALFASQQTRYKPLQSRAIIGRSRLLHPHAAKPLQHMHPSARGSWQVLASSGAGSLQSQDSSGSGDSSAQQFLNGDSSSSSIRDRSLAELLTSLSPDERQNMQQLLEDASRGPSQPRSQQSEQAAQGVASPSQAGSSWHDLSLLMMLARLPWFLIQRTFLYFRNAFSHAAKVAQKEKEYRSATGPAKAVAHAEWLQLLNKRAATTNKVVEDMNAQLQTPGGAQTFSPAVVAEYLRALVQTRSLEEYVGTAGSKASVPDGQRMAALLANLQMQAAGGDVEPGQSPLRPLHVVLPEVKKPSFLDNFMMVFSTTLIMVVVFAGVTWLASIGGDVISRGQQGISGMFPESGAEAAGTVRGGKGASVFAPKEFNKDELPQKSLKTFEDVKGCPEAKNELEEVVEFLRNPDKFTAMGGKLPKGLLLTGPPGTGKTLLARAIAGEAGVPFFYRAGSEFEEMFVGVGSRRMRNLFQAAKKKCPCIVFIDEIDAIGGNRTGFDANGGAKKTLNQLLVEMDGFEVNEGVIVVAATNIPEELDPALTRPGRFDRHVAVPLPDVRGREEILTYYLKDKKVSADVDILRLARGTAGFSGAQLAGMVNEAALAAAKRNDPQLTAHTLEFAQDKLMMGNERRSMVMSAECRRNTAYHEAGHALVALKTPGAMPIRKATIMPRGHTLGMVNFLPEVDKYDRTKVECYASIDTAMGGKAAEELIFGPENTTTGVTSDLKQASRMARHMVAECGMSDQLGPIYAAQKGRGGVSNVSETTLDLIDQEVSRLVREGYQRASNILKENEADLHKLAGALIDYETLTNAEIDQVLAGTFSRPLPTADAILAGGGSVDAIPLPSPVEVPAPANA
eukprot:CAMPEP_0206145058 /NCGR_PEP_ID=MMETSP1473-20131121/26217_1 /ASSEMBLY_ACC=CAM_ASM_001109 /TAXON_ID=1461547 /ORGANISM="Stichococcus sp, Strain RCC1054" /LENGTH=864 /DNA_ID=CAMNT_0053541115 /DNA_START=315 /DNA_END=2909 /DNA_ORIENTATION=+